MRPFVAGRFRWRSFFSCWVCAVPARRLRSFTSPPTVSVVVRVRCSGLCPAYWVSTLSVTAVGGGIYVRCSSYIIPGTRYLVHIIVRMAGCCSVFGSPWRASVQIIRISDNIHQPSLLWVLCSASLRRRLYGIDKRLSRIKYKNRGNWGGLPPNPDPDPTHINVVSKKSGASKKKSTIQ